MNETEAFIDYLLSEEVGTCDVCGEPHNNGDQLDHCGECGNCWAHCDQEVHNK